MRTQKIKNRRHPAKTKKSVREKVAALERELDSLVTRAEKCGKHTNARRTLMQDADLVREKLREISY